MSVATRRLLRGWVSHAAKFARRLRPAVIAIALLAVALVALRALPREPLLAKLPWSTAIYDRNGQLLRLTLADDGYYRLPTPLERQSPQLVAAVLLHEDRGFYRHPGVNPWSLSRGALRTFGVGDRRVGGSTITMQLARRLYRIDSHRVAGKLLQMLRAVQLEALYSKREILEAYLDLAPYGGNVEGAGAAALVYFQRKSASLTLAEALALAVVPQSPARRQPRIGNADLERARAQLFVRWQRAYGAGSVEAAAVATPLAVSRLRDLPFFAPHVTQALLADAASAGAVAAADGSSGSRATRGEITATIDLRLQRLLERQVSGFVQRQGRFGVVNAAALLVDTQDLSVVASVGSAAFFDASIGGQNDGTRARRSPGSALKPFIYALAIDQGLVHPMTVLKDTPQSFGPHAPENFDGEFVGPVTVQDALIRSRNVPAVAIGLQLARPGLHDFLRAAGVGQLAGERHYGISLFLGGAEVTPRELAMLYAALANGGVVRALRDRLDVPGPQPAAAAAGVRLLSEAASFVTLDMLAHNPRPAQAFMNGAVRQRGPVYWKTGTSTGFRDAWSAAVFDRYVLIVWVGNFDGRPNPAFVGVQVAAPLLFQIIDATRATARRMANGAGGLDRPPLMLRPPDALQSVEVCVDSGDLPNAACPRTVATWYIPGVSPIRASTLHRSVRVDSRTGQLACDAAAKTAVRTEIHEYWTSDMLDLFRKAGLARRAPPLASACDRSSLPAAEGRDPAITSPLVGVTYLLRDRGAADAVELNAISDSSNAALYWFVDDAFVGRSERGRTLDWTPPRTGEFVVRVVDDAGRSGRRALRVARAP